MVLRPPIRASILLLCLSWFVAACGGTTTPEPSTGQEGAPELAEEEQQLVEQARSLIASQTGIPAEELTFSQITATEWPDGSLGCPQPGQSYMQVVTSGYQILLNDATGNAYDLRVGVEPAVPMLRCTSDAGAQVPGQDGAAEANAVERARQLVAAQTGTMPEALSAVEVQAVEWNDSSLGCPEPGQMYAEVITPGYHIILQNEAGTTYDVRAASTPDQTMRLCPEGMASGDDGLAGTVWQWQSDQLEDTTNYTIEFQNGGGLAILADCNQGGGTYEMTAENQMTIQIPAMTLIACPPGTLDRPFLEQLITTSGYTLDGDRLTLRTSAGDMVFTRTGGTEPDPASQSAVTGTVNYLPRVALPPGSEIRVMLQDISLADAPAQEITSQTIVTVGENVPIPFELTYDPTQIDENRDYSVRAEIYGSEGELAWTSDTIIPVITQGAPTENVEILVVPVN